MLNGHSKIVTEWPRRPEAQECETVSASTLPTGSMQEISPFLVPDDFLHDVEGTVQGYDEGQAQELMCDYAIPTMLASVAGVGIRAAASADAFSRALIAASHARRAARLPSIPMAALPAEGGAGDSPEASS